MNDPDVTTTEAFRLMPGDVIDVGTSDMVVVDKVLALIVTTDGESYARPLSAPIDRLRTEYPEDA